MLLQVTKAAFDDGWQLSDFLRTLVVLATTEAWIRLGGEENLASLRNREELNQIRATLAKMLPSARPRRPYASRSLSSEDTETTSLILPYGIARRVESYASAHGFSKSDLCGTLVTNGFVMYLAGEASLLQATRQANGLHEPAGS